MILRRLANALKRQDWATVLIEFFLVVAGILVALQADDWAQERENRAKEQLALERLFIEAQAAVDYLDERLERHQGWVDGAEEAIAAFHEPRTPEAEKLMEEKAFYAYFYPPLTLQRVAFDELSASGGMELITSAAVRRDIALYYAYLGFIEEQNKAFRDGREIGEHEAWATSVSAVYSREYSDRMKIIYDWQSLWNNAAYRTHMVGVLRNAIVFQEFRQVLYERAVTMCRSLAEATDNTCNVKREPEVPS